MSQTVEFSAKVPKELYDRFKEVVPAYGGTQWFIVAALSGFVERCERDEFGEPLPSLKANVAASVEAMLQLNRTLKEAGV